MPTQLNPYLSFHGNARQAMEFYHSVFGGQLNVMTFGDSNASSDPSEDNNLMHSHLDNGNGLVLMGADTPIGMQNGPTSNGSISLSGEDEAELRGYWEKLSQGSTIVEPLEKAPWGDHFGMLTDQFGVLWLVNIAGPRA